MMRLFAFVTLFFAYSNIAFAQNLVQNPSFEEYVNCPQGTGELNTQVENWFSWNLSPDFFHMCNNSGLGTAGTPNNAWGIQEPITGSAYAGVYTYAEYQENEREYMATHLIEPLVAGETYYVMFHASMFDGAAKETRLCAINNIGLRFFQDPNYNNFNNPLLPDNFAHLNYEEILSDSENWTKIDGYFTADQAYDWLAIGNFFTDDQTDILILNDENNCSGIYYIENVCVGQSPEDCDYLLNAQNIERQEKVDVFPNPASDFITIQTQGKHIISKVSLIDASGRLIDSWNGSSNDQMNINVEKYKRGFYVLKVEFNEFISSTKLILK